MHVHYFFHASYDVEGDYCDMDINVRSYSVHPDTGEQIINCVHDERRALLWEEGKAISLAYSFNKALSRFAEACSQEVTHF